MHEASVSPEILPFLAKNPGEALASHFRAKRLRGLDFRRFMLQNHSGKKKILDG